MKRGLFIVLEGIDGSGKTLQAKMLARFLKSREAQKRFGHRGVVLTTEPTESPIGKLIERMLTGKWKTDVHTCQLLFSADRSHHLATTIVPALERGDIVVSARYFFSTLAYGGVTLPLRWLRVVTSQFLVPDVIVYIDLPPKVAMERVKKRGNNRNLFEKERFLAKVRANYRTIFRKFPHAYTVNGSQSVNAIFDQIVSVVRKELE